MNSSTSAGASAALQEVLALCAAGELQAASLRCAEAITKGGGAGAYRLAGLIALRMERWPEAQDHLARIVEEFATDPEVLFGLAYTHYQSSRIDESVEGLLRLLAVDPLHADGNFLLARIAERKGDDAAAIRAYETVAATNPRRADAWWNLCLLRMRTGDRTGALAAADKVIATSASVNAHRVRAALLEEHGRFDACADDLAEVLKLAPPDPNTALALAAHRFRQERLADAWEAYRRRDLLLGPHGRPFASQRWEGQDLTGKTILCSYDQGLGEQIMFAGMLPELLSRARRVVVECERRLVPLFARSFPAAEFLPYQKPPHPRLGESDVDFHLPLGDLGKWLRPDMAAFPRHSGYLVPPSGKREELRRDLRAMAGGRPIVGISWASLNPTKGSLKSLPVERFMSLMRAAPAFYVNLQYGPVADQIDAVNDGTLALHKVPDIDAQVDIDSLSALVGAVDVLVTVSNATAHLAGALGVNTCVLLAPHLWRYWYWFPHRLQCPWYPSVTPVTDTAQGFRAADGRALEEVLLDRMVSSTRET